MVSYHGYWSYHNIIQAEPIEKERKFRIKPDTISGFLHTSNDFTFFSWLIKKAEMEMKMGHEQFDSTLFLVKDEDIKKQMGPNAEDFFVQLDKNTAYHILYSHLLDKKIHKRTLMSQRLTKLFTKNDKKQIMFLNNNGDVSLNNIARLVQEDIILSNGVIHIIDHLLF